MLHREYLQSQWLMLSLLIGLGVVLLLCAAYAAFWRRRQETPPGENGEASVRVRRGFVPWFLVVIIAGTAVWGVCYTIWMILYPPNW